eukprot:TRINITY_DN8067_c0_g1_i1.p1 TRINITY_DN8067_c0_g1~~TRINITY_DN8067_c0_g1_i1.p1  ORF type:complete len:125 (+),score=20.30 TRINITY_DN8067_c0_g1_i1:85-459(+)
MASPDDVANAFVKHYYALFDSNRLQLTGLYQNESMLSFEGSKVQGVKNIVDKLTSLPFERVAHKVTTIDAQPSPGNGVVVYVTGALMVDDQPQPLMFSQVFNLLPTSSGSYYVLNDMFRLNYSI